MTYLSKYFFSFGDFKGGELRCYSADEQYYLDLKTKDKPYIIDARLYHEVLPFVGTRYTFVVYKTSDFNMDEPSQIYDIVSSSEDKKKHTQNIVLMNTIYRIIGLDTRGNISFMKKDVDILYPKYMNRKDTLAYNAQNYEVYNGDKSDVCKGKWNNILKCILYNDLMSIMNHFIDKYSYSSLFVMSIVNIIDYLWDQVSTIYVAIQNNYFISTQ